MTWMDRRLCLALACSLLLHALPFLAGLQPHPKAAAAPNRPLEARLLPPPPAPPPLVLPEPPKPAPAPAARKPPQPAKARPRPRETAQAIAGAAREQAMQQLARQLLYPEEAIARGLEGEAVVFLVLNEAGDVVAARIEQSSGHRILDDAALRAVRSLKSLPAETPREVVLPVRFRLR